MKHSLATLFITLWSYCAAVAQITNEEVRFRATVEDVRLLSRFPGTLTAVDADSKFAITVQIASAVPAMTNFTVGNFVTFGIHSPSMLFRWNATIGKAYDFTLHRKIEGGKATFLDLKIQRTNNSGLVSIIVEGVPRGTYPCLDGDTFMDTMMEAGEAAGDHPFFGVWSRNSVILRHADSSKHHYRLRDLAFGKNKNVVIKPGDTIYFPRSFW